MTARRIAIATFGRSDLSILRPLAQLLHDHPSFETGWIVAGAHADDESGVDADELASYGPPVWAVAAPSRYERTAVGAVHAMAEQTRAAGDALAELRPDLLVLLGDRFEAVATGLASVPLGLPVAHISGGSVTEGAIDDVFRHCLTKIAVLHFCDLPLFARRIHRMGEDPATIHTTGALGLDALVAAEVRPFDDLRDRFGLDGVSPGYALATVHPESRRLDRTDALVEQVILALARSDLDVVFTYPNADPGSDRIVRAIRSASERPGWAVVPGFGLDWFPSALAHAGLVIGNSSSGIIEAASFGLPVVDIGDRQKGRDHGRNVVHSSDHVEDIGRALREVTAAGFRSRAGEPNIYGDGRGAERVLTVLDGLDWDSLVPSKSFAPYDPAFDGVWRR